jgi:ABC-type Na+ efflux pump permease subunit
MKALTGPYQRAAVAYLVYGLVYLLGAVLQLTPDRQRDFFGFVPWWVFYLAGVLVICTLPVFIWRQHKWFTRVLCFFPAIKALSLCVKQGRLLGAGEPSDIYNWFFAVVALVAAGLLFRAGWGTQKS